MAAGADSTLRDVRAVSAGPLPHWGRKIGLAVLLVVVVAGATGWLGVHTRSASRTADGYRLTVSYPQVARAGLDVEWTVRLHRDGGIRTGFTIAVDADYFDIFESQGFSPEPDSETTNGKQLLLRFGPPPGNGADFRLDFDGYIQPASQRGRATTVAVLIRGKAVVQQPIRTWLVP